MSPVKAERADNRKDFVKKVASGPGGQFLVPIGSLQKVNILCCQGGKQFFIEYSVLFV